MQDKKQIIKILIVVCMISLVVLGGLLILNQVQQKAEKQHKVTKTVVEGETERSLSTEAGYEKAVEDDEIYDVISRLENKEEQKEQIRLYFTSKLEGAGSENEKASITAAWSQALASIGFYEEARSKLLEAYRYNTTDENVKNDLCGAVFVLMSETGDVGWTDEYKNRCFVEVADD